MTPDWNLDFDGKDLDLDACEALLHTRWPPKEMRAEAALFQSKFWDYRHLHPVHATYLFAHIFTVETRAIIRAHIDNTPPRTLPSGHVLDWYPLGSGDVFEPAGGKLQSWQRKVKALIRARQFADRYGMPYSFFIRHALRHYYFGRYYLFDDERRTLPGPDMLNGEDCRIAVAEAWIEELGTRIHHATHPRYLVENDCGHHDVKAHQQALCDQIAKRSDPSYALKRFIGNGLLSPAVAAERFGTEHIAKA